MGGYISVPLGFSVRIRSILRSKAATQRRKCAKSSARRPSVSRSANDFCRLRPCSMTGAAFSVSTSAVLRRSPGTGCRCRKPVNMKRHDRGLQSAHPADRARRLAAGIIRQKQQNIHRRRRQTGFRAQRRKRGVIGVRKACSIGKHGRRGQKGFRHELRPPISNCSILN